METRDGGVWATARRPVERIAIKDRFPIAPWTRFSPLVECPLKISDHELLHLQHSIHGSQGLLSVGAGQ